MHFYARKEEFFTNTCMRKKHHVNISVQKLWFFISLTSRHKKNIIHDVNLRIYSFNLYIELWGNIHNFFFTPPLSFIYFVCVWKKMFSFISRWLIRKIKDDSSYSNSWCPNVSTEMPLCVIHSHVRYWSFKALFLIRFLIIQSVIDIF